MYHQQSLLLLLRILGQTANFLAKEQSTQHYHLTVLKIGDGGGCFIFCSTNNHIHNDSECLPCGRCSINMQDSLYLPQNNFHFKRTSSHIPMRPSYLLRSLPLLLKYFLFIEAKNIHDHVVYVIKNEARHSHDHLSCDGIRTLLHLICVYNDTVLSNKYVGIL